MVRRVFALNNATHHAHSLRVGGVTRVPEVGRLEHCPPLGEKLAVQNCSTDSRYSVGIQTWRPSWCSAIPQVHAASNNGVGWPGGEPVLVRQSPRQRKPGVPCNWNPASPRRSSQCQCSVRNLGVEPSFRHFNTGTPQSNPILHQRQRIAAEDSPRTSPQARKHELRAGCHRIRHQ